jgi:MFS family permease
MLSHPLFLTLRNLKGNPRACVYTEPMFGIPYTLFGPYVSVYMLALGLKDQHIGLLSSLGLGIQIFTSLVSGAITDKLGRRLTLFLSDLLCWSVPCLIWAIAQDFRYFLLAALFNSIWRISHTAWTCLMVEDAEPNDVVHIWTWVYIFSVGSALFAPLAGVLVERFTLEPAVRGFYWFAFTLMTVKFVILFLYSTETRRGAERILETRRQSILSLLGEYRRVLNQLLHARLTLVVVALMLVMSIYHVVNSAFWAVLVTEKLHIPSEHIAIYPFIRSIVMLTSFFLITPRLSTLHFQRPVALGFGGVFLSQILLISMPERSYLLLSFSAILEAFAAAMVGPMVESLLVVTMDAAERARLTAIIYMIILVFTSPFGWVAGQLSAVNRSLPFVFNAGLFVVGAGLVWLAGRLSRIRAVEMA